MIRILVLILLISLLNLGKAQSSFPSVEHKKQVTEIPAYGKNVSFSDIAQEGNISIFIIGYTTCGFCKKLKNTLSDSLANVAEVDLYYIDLTKDKNSNEYTMQTFAEQYPKELSIWNNIEKVTVYPSVVLLGPTKNTFSRYDPQFLREIKYNEGIANKTLDIVKEHLQFSAVFNANTLLKTASLPLCSTKNVSIIPISVIQPSDNELHPKTILPKETIQKVNENERNLNDFYIYEQYKVSKKGETLYGILNQDNTLIKNCIEANELGKNGGIEKGKTYFIPRVLSTDFAPKTKYFILERDMDKVKKLFPSAKIDLLNKEKKGNWASITFPPHKS